jgi:hypothetical protein
MDATPPEERIYLSVSNEVDAPRQCTFNASIAPTSSPNFETSRRCSERVESMGNRFGIAPKYNDWNLDKVLIS